ncbi:hypothetical protein HDU67_000196, partial [Dinochytrium kinnereticum]
MLRNNITHRGLWKHHIDTGTCPAVGGEISSIDLEFGKISQSKLGKALYTAGGKFTLEHQEAWKMHDALIVSLLRKLLSVDIQRKLQRTDSAKDIWDFVEAKMTKATDNELGILLTQWIELVIGKWNCLVVYMDETRRITERFKALKTEMPLQFVLVRIQMELDAIGEKIMANDLRRLAKDKQTFEKYYEELKGLHERRSTDQVISHAKSAKSSDNNCMGFGSPAMGR